MRYFITTLLAVLITTTGFSQSTKTIFDGEKLVWCGLDFSRATMIGVTDVPAKDLVSKFFAEWNNATVYEKDKFYLESFFRKMNVYYDMTSSTRHNEAVNPANLLGTEAKPITRADIEKLVADYTDLKRKEGLGLIFVIESFNKKKELAVAHCTYFDIATRKVLLTKEVSGKPGGGGLKNFWTRSIAGMMQTIDKTLFEQWRSELSK